MLNMRATALEVLACPVCRSSLEADPSATGVLGEGELRCPREDLRYPVRGGIPWLLAPDRAAAVEAFATSYAQAWGGLGWGALQEDYFLGLPWRDATGRHKAEWRVKARSMEALFNHLDATQWKRVVDLGCGMGWLSHHMARRGHEVYAVDAVRDDRIGLGAAVAYLRRGPHFERVGGELERPPFRDGVVDASVCNASLHYTRDLRATLRATARILRTGGLFVVLNSPVHRDSASAMRAQRDFQERLRRMGAVEQVASTYRHFVRSELVDALQAEVGPVQEIPFDPGYLFRLTRRAKGVILGMELASFPIFSAQKAD